MARSLPDIAELPVRNGIRLLALEYLDHAEEARLRMAGDRDDEALHDFRVALRRLRSCLRAYRPHFADTVRGKIRRAVRDLARATGEARDLEVHLAWLAGDRGFSPAAAEGAAIMAERLRRAKFPADRAALQAGENFPAVRARLEPALLCYCEEIDRRDPGRTLTCAGAAARQAVPDLEELAAALAAIRSVEDGTAIHEARISGKRVRYLLEPYRSSAAGGERLLKRIRRFQDNMGDQHDLDVLLQLTRAETEAHPEENGAGALMALVEHIRAERTATFRRIRRSWLGARAGALLAEARAFAAALAAGSPGLEVERKYLLHSLPRMPEDPIVLRVDQGYLPGERLVERVRRVRGPEATRYFRTVKLGSGVRRIEVEEETDEQTFRALWRLTKGRRVSKRRYVVADGDRTWEIDRFTGRKLVLAEVELADEDAAVEMPDWLASRVVREVTDEPEYLNVNLAR